MYSTASFQKINCVLFQLTTIHVDVHTAIREVLILGFGELVSVGIGRNVHSKVKVLLQVVEAVDVDPQQRDCHQHHNNLKPGNSALDKKHTAFI